MYNIWVAKDLFVFGSFIVYVMYLLAIFDILIDILKISAHRVNELTLSIFALIKISNKYQ